MSEATIPVDLFNPGQVFACLGFLEAADVLLGDAEGGFDWKDEAGVKFVLRANGDQDPVAAVLAFLMDAKVRTVAPDPSVLSTEKWGVSTDLLGTGQSFPFELPKSPATLPAILIGASLDGKERQIPLEYWGDSTNRDNVKFWAGSAGYPGAALARDALTLIRGLKSKFDSNLFDLSSPQSSSFRFDWRRDYIALDKGFALNDHSNIHIAGFPIVESLAAIGVSHARPERRSKLHYRYSVLGLMSQDRLFDAAFLRAALGCAPLPFPHRVFSMHLGWSGQENQARCITEVVEEPHA